MMYGGKKQMYGVADFLSESTNAQNAVKNGNVQIGNGILSNNAAELINATGANGMGVFSNANGSIIGNARKNNNAAAGAANGTANGKNANGNASVGNNNATALPNADQTALAVAELDYLRNKLGERNFGVLSGDDERVVAVFASPGEASARAELEQIDNAGALIDTFALLDVLLNDPDVAMNDERRALLETLRESTRARLADVLGTAPPAVTPMPKDESVWTCVKRMETNEIVILSLAVVAAIAIVSALLLFFFRRRCPKPAM